VSGTTKEIKRRSMAGEVAVRYFRKPLAVLGAVILAVIVIMCLLAPVIAPYDYDAQDVLRKFTEPCRQFPCGTDNLGRDIFSRLLYGGRISLMVGFVSATVAAVAGVVFGAIAAFYGGKVDNLIMRFLDAFNAIPDLLLAIAISSVMGGGVLNAILAIGISSVPAYARTARGPILAVKEQEFVEAARALDARDRRIIFRHILPNVLSPIIVHVSTGISGGIITAAALSFLGLGVQAPTPEWGALLSASRQYIREYPYLVTVPGVCIAMVVLAMNLFGDGLRDALDPKLKY